MQCKWQHQAETERLNLTLTQMLFRCQMGTAACCYRKTLPCNYKLVLCADAPGSHKYLGSKQSAIDFSNPAPKGKEKSPQGLG